VSYKRFDCCRNRNRDGAANQKKKTGLKRDLESPP